MKVREVTIFSGHRFEVPQCIQRIDHLSTHGWQLRYGGTKLFSDGKPDGEGADEALAQATKELIKRIARLPAPTMLQSAPNANKTSNLPVGISGPIVRQRPGSRLYEGSFSVSLPCFGKPSKRRSVYIGTENTYTPDRYELALAKCIRLRTLAEEKYQQDATRARRAAARALKVQQEQRQASAGAN